MRLQAILLLGLLMARPLHAESREPPKTGSHISREQEWESYSQPEIRQIQRLYGDCVIKKHRREAQSVVVGVADTKTYLKLIGKVADGDCLVAASPGFGSTVAMRLSDDLLKYTLADALVRSELPNGPVADLDRVPLLVHRGIDPALLKPDQTAEWNEEWREKRKVYDQVSQYGECVVRADPSDSYALLSAKPGSQEEDAAFSRLPQALSECLAPGQTIAFQKATLRGTIALNYYRLAFAPRLQQQVAAGASK